MKQLLAAGYPKIFQICKCFRENERGKKHLLEFTMLEWYEAGATYFDLMKHCELLFQWISNHLKKTGQLSYQSCQINIMPPWPRISVAEAFSKFASTDLETAITNNNFDEAIAFEIEPRLGIDHPVFLYDYPAATCPLAEVKPDNPDFAQRFELYMAGLELCNGFTELTDPDTQRERFEQEIKSRRSSGQEIYPMPENFLTALSDMPPAAGNALGIDRLVMLFADTNKIDDVVSFIPEEL